MIKFKFVFVEEVIDKAFHGLSNCLKLIFQFDIYIIFS